MDILILVLWGLALSISHILVSRTIQYKTLFEKFVAQYDDPNSTDYNLPDAKVPFDHRPQEYDHMKMEEELLHYVYDRKINEEVQQHKIPERPPHDAVSHRLETTDASNVIGVYPDECDDAFNSYCDFDPYEDGF
jgi:hypothetical protein